MPPSWKPFEFELSHLNVQPEGQALRLWRQTSSADWISKVIKRIALIRSPLRQLTQLA
jgi:hypothetical protein